MGPVRGETRRGGAELGRREEVQTAEPRPPVTLARRPAAAHRSRNCARLCGKNSGGCVRTARLALPFETPNCEPGQESGLALCPCRDTVIAGCRRSSRVTGCAGSRF